MKIPIVSGLLQKKQNQLAANAIGGNFYSQQQNAAVAAESMRQMAQAGRNSANTLKTPDEKVLEALLHPDIPDRPELKKYYALASDAARHLALTNIPDDWVMHRFKEFVADLFTVGAWSAPEYFNERQLKFETQLHLYKSAGWTKNSRERDALNESRITQKLTQETNTAPRETGNFFGALWGR